MTSVNQDLTPSKPQTFKVITHYGYIPLLVDVDGSRWLHLPPFAEWLGLSLVRDIMPRIDSKQRFWGVKLIGGKQCLPADKANSFMGILRVEHAKGPMVAWLGNHCTQTLRNFTIPEVQTPFLVAEPEPIPVSFARPAPQFYAPVVPAQCQLVTVLGTEAVTSTLLIAEGTDNQHKNVIELVRTYTPQLEQFGRVAFETQPFATSGGVQSRDVAFLNEPQSTLLITFMRNSDIVVDFKTRLVKAFYELKNRAAVNPILTMSRLDLLKMAVQSEEKVLTLECKVQEQGTTIEVQQASISVMEPKADAMDRLAGANGTTCISGAAKALKVKTMTLTEYMEAHKWVFRRVGPRGPGEMMAFQDRINAGLLDHRIVPITHRDGSLTSKNQILVTAKGLTKLAQGLGIAS